MLLPMMLRGGQRVLFWLLILGALAAARAELILAHFSVTDPIKIMPVGDSITDDCVTNGAWRAPLQPLLETNGIVFTNTGRLLSGSYPGFSKRKHEGYCGTVIAPPGIVAAHNYSTADNYLQRIVRDALAITNNWPHLLLILVGANDVGHGRNPWYLATNDMPNLLSVIFSNVPNANVILAKITTLQDASLAYATNVPIYNAALQAMVNPRRALGENVFLADMFSVVDYNTMFLSDHLHPNPVGLKAIANEWVARVETIVIRTNQIASVFVNGGADWKYSDTGQDPGTNWAQPGYDDSGWSHGIARLGYGDPATATTVSFGPDPTNKFVTTYFRRSFVVPWNAVIINLNFRLARAGGAAVWLNGQEMFRANLPDGPITYTNLALRAMTGYTPHIFYPTNFAVAGLPTGTNLVAVEIHQSSVTRPAFGFDMELIGSGSLVLLPTLSITLVGNNVLLSWLVMNANDFALYSTINLTSAEGWTMMMPAAQTNGGQIIVTQSPDTSAQFFRLQRP